MGNKVSWSLLLTQQAGAPGGFGAVWPSRLSGSAEIHSLLGARWGDGLFTLHPDETGGETVTPFVFPWCHKKKSDFITQRKCFFFSFFLSLLSFFPTIFFFASFPSSFFLPCSPLFPLSLSCFFLLSKFHNEVLLGESLKRNKSFIFRARGIFFFFWPEIYLQLKELRKYIGQKPVSYSGQMSMESTKRTELHGDLSKYVFGKSGLEYGFYPCPCLYGPLSQTHPLKSPSLHSDRKRHWRRGG